jgi:acyl carrier protein
MVMNTFELIKNAICKVQPGIDASKIVPTAHLGEDLEIDSLGRVELALAMEESFGFYLPDDELENVVTVGDAIDLIETKLRAKNA